MAEALVGTIVLFGVGWLASGRRRDGLVPAAILGGVLGLVLRQLDVLPGSVDDWQQVGYHLFGLSFLAIGLTRPRHPEPVTGGAIWIGVGQGFSFALQAVAGGLATMALLAAGRDLFPAFGFLAPMGLEEGPGQAVSIGGIWEAAGFVDAPTLGATIASVGFVLAYGLGLVALRVRGGSPGAPATADGQAGAAAAGPGSADPAEGPARRLATGRMVLATAATVAGYGVLYVVVGWLAGMAGPDVRDTVLGVLFFLALLVGLGVRALAAGLGWSIAPEPQQALTVASVDGLTVAILSSLAWARIAAAALPLAAVLVATLVATVAGVAFAARQLRHHRFERALALFGTVTGTVSSGLALLSLRDPDQATPVAVELGSSVVVSAPVVLGGVALATAAARGGLALGAATAAFAVVALVAGGVLVWAGRRFDSL